MSRPTRILELRSVRGTGGGPEKTILLGTARTDPSRYQITVCYIRDARDPVFDIGAQARRLGVEYVELIERHSLDLRLWPALRRLVRERAIDVVHAHDYKTDLLALLLAWAEGVIPLATAHGWTGDSRREQVYYFFDKRLLARFPRLVAVSGEIRDELIRAGARPRRVRIVLNSIDPNAFHRDPNRVPEARRALGLEPGHVAIGVVGRLELQKRFDLLLQAFAKIAQQRPELRLFIAGEGSRGDELRDLAARLGLGQSCRFLGHCRDVVGLHHALDLFVQSSDYEGTSNSLLEAMALETPIVATAVGGTAEVAADGVHALLVPPGDASALASAMTRALADAAATRQRCAAARARVEQELSFAARMRAVEAIYDELMATRSRGAGGGRR